ncbi:RNA 2',3'-cyclic phosphodiesterase [Bacillus sp. DJP31]|uniref:RNA 2',3'-cyclic phosphodiesterase n=1 Tax=Bacillus sp. DJP31 TaxID=3409789 RepID=UPI003BB4BD93
MNETHYFLAVPIPQEIKLLYFEWIELVKEKLPFKTWVHPDDYHLTLAFLGDASFPKIQDVKNEMKRIVKEHDSFRLQVSGLGTFGSSESPRIFWSGVERQPLLEKLQRDVFQACQNVGFDLETRPFHPHMTLARRWIAESPFPFNELPELIHPKQELLSFKVNHVVLYQTHLDRSPKYLPLSIFSLEK